MKIFGKHTYDKELASKIHNRFLKFNHREKKKQSNWKMGKNWIDTSTRRCIDDKYA